MTRHQIAVRHRAGGARRAALAGAFTAALLSSAPAFADALRFGTHEGYGRIAFDWDMPVEYTAAITDGVLEVQFARPLTGDVAPSARVLSGYVTAAQVDTERMRARFTLRAGVTMRAYKVGNIVVVDLRGGGGELLQTVAAPASPAAASTAVTVRTGTHPGFFRLAFDWPSRVEYHIERRGDRVAVVFAQAATINIDALNRNLPAQNRPAQVVLENGATVVLIPFAEVFAINHFRNANTIAIDLTDKPAPPSAQVAAAPPAPVLPPVETQTVAPKAATEVVVANQPAPPPAAKAAVAAKPAAPPPAGPSSWSVRPRVDVGYTYYRVHFNSTDPLAGLGGTDTANYRVTDRSVTGNYNAAAFGRPRNYAFVEGTMGINAAWQNWWGDVYYRTALHDPMKPFSSRVSYTAERFQTPGTATREVNTTTYTSDPELMREQLGLTLGYAFDSGLSAHVTYMNTRTSLRGTRFFSNTSTVDRYPNTLTGFPLVGPSCCTTTTTTSSPLIGFKESIVTQSVLGGLGYVAALDEASRHFLTTNGGLAYSHAFGQYVDGQSLGVWGNVGYQFYLTPNLALSLSGEGYRFDYGGTRGFTEIWASGRLGLSYMIN